MRNLNHRALVSLTAQMSIWTVIAAPVLAQPKIDGDNPGYSAGASVAYTIAGNPLDQGDFIFSVFGSYRSRAGYWGINGSLGFANPTSAFARSLGKSADLLLVDFSVVRYLNYPPEIDRTCGGEQAAADHIQPWHCGRRFKSEPFVFAGPGLALLEVDDAFPNLPISDASEDFFTINFGFGVRLYRLQINQSQELAPGLWYQPGYQKSRWYLRPEVMARWFAGGNDEIDWSVGLGVGYNFDKGSTHGALCMQIEESCHLARRVAEVSPPDPGGDGVVADRFFEALRARRDQLQEYKVRLRDSGADCGICLQDSLTMVNEALDKLRRPPGDSE